MTAGADAIVVGGGLHGCSAALHLAMRGARVLVLEKDTVARHASGVNAGGVRRLGRDLAEIPLADAAARVWHAIGDLVDDDCGFQPSGQVKIGETEAEMAEMAARVERIRALGFAHEVLIGADELRERLPAVAGHCRGAIVVDGDGHANPFRTTQAFHRKARALGVRFLEGTAVRDLARAGGAWTVDSAAGHSQAPVLVNCAGAWGAAMAAKLGEPVPLSAEAFMLMVTQPMAPFVGPVVGAWGRALSFKQLGNGAVLIGGGHRGLADPDANRAGVDVAGLAASARTAAAIFPVMRHAAVVRAWAGIEGETPDKIPVIGESATAEGAFHAFGFSGHGFQLGPIVGRVVADLVTDGATDLPIEAFRIDRFAN
ncbi:MAG: FAD-dependent oxidoreductase [Magnetovibrio sp.]|nr:FAD-dependent oxidoreductase [Magnetovibrio sp.]